MDYFVEYLQKYVRISGLWDIFVWIRYEVWGGGEEEGVFILIFSCSKDLFLKINLYIEQEKCLIVVIFQKKYCVKQCCLVVQ